MVDVLSIHEKSRYGCHVGISKSPDMVDALLAQKKSTYGCCPLGIFNSPDMVDVLLVHKESRHDYYFASIFKIKEKGS